MLLLLCVLTLIISGSTPASALSVSTSTYENCGGASSALKILSSVVTYSEGSSEQGSVGTLSIKANVTTSIDIIQGGAEVSGLIVGRVFSLETVDFCSMTSCPIAPATIFRVSKNVSVSVVPPPGVEVNIKILVRNGRDLLGCFNIRFDFDYNAYNVIIT
ncbi:hypothetical protein BC829DRAFT_26236 [Chytridium lagenaria]|nr:hypothetical protein BC829DRAFT_26236 [Chytridium lagenaria]